MKILNTKEIMAEIYGMIGRKKSCLLITPFIDLDNTFIDKLMLPNTKIHIIYRSKQNDESITKIKELEAKLTNIKFFDADNLHAKIYLSSDKIILATMNLYDYSSRHNFELGVAFNYNENCFHCKNIIEETYNFLSINKLNPSRILLAELYNIRHCKECGEWIEETKPEKYKYCDNCAENWRQKNDTKH